MMQTFNVRNVNEAYAVGVNALLATGVPGASRVSAVRAFDGPVTTSYRQPCERVLFNEQRDANPFFHFMEGLWMLAGREDVEWISQFNSQIQNYSDNGKIFHGAYGYRWRYHFGFDQLQELLAHLHEEPNSRRAIISMWDPSDDLNTGGLDIPCNTTIAFRIRQDGKLHMTVFCRSNDMIWGAYGANVVHMSMLLEYLAAFLEVEVGEYHQISNDMHAYQDILDKVGKPDPHPMCPYEMGHVRTFPLVADPGLWNMDLANFMMNPEQNQMFSNSVFSEVARPMYWAWKEYKNKNYLRALSAVDHIRAEDWHKACKRWISRRTIKHAEKTAGGKRPASSHIQTDSGTDGIGP
jgi:hypothetical protein